MSQATQPQRPSPAAIRTDLNRLRAEHAEQLAELAEVRAILEAEPDAQVVVHPELVDALALSDAPVLPPRATPVGQRC